MKKKLFYALCALTLLGMAFASCQKQDVAKEANSPSAETSSLSSKTTPIKVLIIVGSDTISFQGTIQREEDGSFCLEGVLTMPNGDKYNVQGRLNTASRTFNGTITDEQGNTATMTDELMDALIQVADYQYAVMRLSEQYRE